MNDQELRDYLLRRLPDAEAERLEERLLEDGELFATLRSVEDDLVDDHARGRLAPSERERFLARYGSQPARLAFAAALAKKRRATIVPFARRQWLPLAAAAALTVAIGGIALRPGPDSAPSPAPVARPEPTAASPVVVLSLATSRASAAAPEVTLAPDAATLSLRVRLDPGDRFDRYSIELRSAADRIVWRGDDLETSAEAGEPGLRVTLPAAGLSDGAYELAVRGRTGSAPAEDLGFVTLRVRRKP